MFNSLYQLIYREHTVAIVPPPPKKKDKKKQANKQKNNKKMHAQKDVRVEQVKQTWISMSATVKWQSETAATGNELNVSHSCMLRVHKSWWLYMYHARFCIASFPGSCGGPQEPGNEANFCSKQLVITKLKPFLYFVLAIKFGNAITRSTHTTSWLLQAVTSHFKPSLQYIVHYYPPTLVVSHHQYQLEQETLHGGGGTSPWQQ